LKKNILTWFVLFFFILCTICCQFLCRIVFFWLPLRCYLTFIYIHEGCYMNRTGWNYVSVFISFSLLTSCLWFVLFCFRIVLLMKEEFEDTKGVIRIRISKKNNRQHNGLKKKYKRTNKDLQNIPVKTKDRVTWTALRIEGELRCSGRVSSNDFCLCFILYNTLILVLKWYFYHLFRRRQWYYLLLLLWPGVAKGTFSILPMEGTR
jgi:hypothetical protein